MEQTKSQLGVYRLYERIGSGGFATVHIARDTRTNEVVAIKVLHPHLAQDADLVARFQREAQVLRKLPPHPNIVLLRDVGQEDDVHFLVFEYLDGKTLSQILAEHKKEHKLLPVRDAISIAIQIARALDVAFHHGLVHRDIKPGNIQITPQGVAKVMDFGIAHVPAGTQLTQIGTLLGSPDYMAPELWEGEPADIRSDLYALGALLCEMLTGTSPFHADTLVEAMNRHRDEVLPPVRTKRAEVPPEVEVDLARLLAKQPEARPQTPAELLAAMENWQGQIPEQQAPAVSSKGISRNTRLVAILGCAVVGLFLLFAFLVAATLHFLAPLSPTVESQNIPSPTAVVPTSQPPQTSAPAPTLTPVGFVIATPFTPTATLITNPPNSPTPRLGEERTISGAPMVFVAAGEFTMGGIDRDTSPAHTVYLDAFWIDKYEVTNALYKKCVDAGGCKSRQGSLGEPSHESSAMRLNYFENPQFANYPVIEVSWDDANKFCAWAGKRLPTEAEWEKAARGTDRRVYPWGDTFDKTKLNFGDSSPLIGDTSEVVRYPSGASPYSALDMAGNVWEWVADWYDADYYANSPKDNPKGPTQGSARGLRGGSWSSTTGIRTTDRFYLAPTRYANDIGFRCAQ